MSIDDEPLIEKVEASISAEALEKAIAASAAAEKQVAHEASIAEKLGALTPAAEMGKSLQLRKRSRWSGRSL